MTKLGGGFGATPSSHGNRSNMKLAVTCNRCRKPLTTTLYVLGCNCVLCEGCAHAHFSTSQSCPCCSKLLQESDLTELVLAESTVRDSTKDALQKLFTKHSSTPRLAQEEWCQYVLKTMDDQRRIVHFVLRQLVHESKVQAQSNGHAGQAFEQMKEQNTQLKQALNTAQLQFEQKTTELQHQLQARDTKIAQLQDMIEKDNRSRIPSSEHSASSGGGGRRGPSNAQRRLTEGFRIHQSSSSHTMRPASGPTITPVQVVPPSRPYSHSHVSVATFGVPVPPANTSHFHSSASGHTFTRVASSSSSSSGNNNPYASRPQMSSPTTAFAYNTGSHNGHHRPLLGRR